MAYEAGSLGGAENMLAQYSRRGILNRALYAAFAADEAADEFDPDDLNPGVLLMRARAHGVASEAFARVLAVARDEDFGPDGVDTDLRTRRPPYPISPRPGDLTEED